MAQQHDYKTYQDASSEGPHYAYENLLSPLLLYALAYTTYPKQPMTV
jgi:hypothetical protein